MSLHKRPFWGRSCLLSYNKAQLQPASVWNVVPAACSPLRYLLTEFRLHGGLWGQTGGREDFSKWAKLARNKCGPSTGLRMGGFLNRNPSSDTDPSCNLG